jgi:hypothetical protein
METILWTCIEAQKLINNVKLKMDEPARSELIQIFKEGSPRTCNFIDAKAD